MSSAGLAPQRWPFGADPRTEGMFVVVGAPAIAQGWKIHVSCRTDEYAACLAAALPILARAGSFKYAASEAEARRINDGMAGLTQVGKIITAYPASPDAAVALGTDLAEALAGRRGPVIEGELKIAPDAPVYARYGGFSRNRRRTATGLWMDVLVSPDGEEVPDMRGMAMHERLGVAVPFPHAAPVELPATLGGRFVTVGTLLETRRSRIASAVDLDRLEPCLLKIVRDHSSLDMFGADASDRLSREHETLVRLQALAVAPAPRAFLREAGRAILAMDHVLGETLLHLGGDHADRTLSRLEMLYSSVARLHELGYSHGDLNPANIIVDGGDLRLLDFEFFNSDGRGVQAEFGTRGYTAPQVMRGLPARAHHDLYSLAAITFMLETGIDLASVPEAPLMLASHGDLNLATGPLIDSLLEGCAAELEPRACAALATAAARLPRSRAGWERPRQRATAPLRHEELTQAVHRQVQALLTLGDFDASAPSIWTSEHHLTRGDRFIDLHLGDAGIILALLRAGVATSNVDTIADAVAAAEILRDRCRAEAPALPGLFVGDAGPALLFLAAHRLTGDAEWLDAAARWGLATAALPCPSPDLLHGLAGRGLLHSWLYEQTGAKEHRRICHSVVDALRASMIDGLWETPPGQGGISGNRLLGLAHGSAGIAYFLAESIRVWPGEDAESLLQTVLTRLEREAEPNATTGMIDWRDAPGGQFRGGVWCHGAAGVAMALARAGTALVEPRLTGLAGEALQGAFAQASRLGPTQCHGLAGLIEAQLDVARATGSATEIDQAHWCARRLLRYYSSDSEAGAMICSERADTFTPEFMVGSSGAMAALARLLAPSRLGSLLLPPHEAFIAIDEA